MDSESSAHACASQRHHRYMIFGKKQRYIEVFQCSGEDMNLVLTGAVAPPSTKALLSPGTLSTQSPASLTHSGPATPVPMPVPTAQPPLWDIQALVQAQAQAQAAQVQAQAQAQAQVQAIRNQDFWLMALASNASPTSTTPASPTSSATSKTLALTAPNPPHQIPAYAMTPPAAAAAAAAAAALHAQQPTHAPFLLFNVPSRIPILRAPTSHGILTPIVAQTAPINPAALMGLKRTWESAFPTETPGTVAKRAAAWHPPTAAFHAHAPTAAPALPYTAQFYPQI